MQTPVFHQARKRFGQNFLVDQGVINRLVRCIGAKPSDNLVEIGPGQGALTEPLLACCPSLQVVEVDRDLVKLLTAKFGAYPQLVIHQADALKFDFASLAAAGSRLRVVGNLPYNISTPLLFHLLGFHGLVEDMHFMLQKEVVERMAAKHNEKAYGRLSVMCQYYCEVESLFEVPPESFRPAPKVDSAIVRLVPHKQPKLVARDPALLSKVVNTAFQQRRKTLRNALKSLLDAKSLDGLDLDTGQRPENLSLAQYVRLADYLADLPPRDAEGTP